MRLGLQVPDEARVPHTAVWIAKWALEKVTMMSTRDVAVTLGDHSVKNVSRTQVSAARSSAENELYCLVKCRGRNFRWKFSSFRCLGFSVGGVVKSDASAALGIVQWQGLGKLTHIGVISLQSLIKREGRASAVLNFFSTSVVRPRMRPLSGRRERGWAFRSPCV